jgi:hypothetical protein
MSSLREELQIPQSQVQICDLQFDIPEGVARSLQGLPVGFSEVRSRQKSSETIPRT